jgi:signal peptidase II
MILKRYIRDYSVLTLIAGIVIALDQYTKFIVRTNLSIGEMWSPWEWLTPYARFVYWTNTGASFGMFQQFGEIFKYFALVVAALIIFYYPQVPKEDWTFRLALSLQLGGALGNFIDRVTLGYVVDFISVGNFAVFNVADSCIVVGVAVLILGMIIQERKEKKLAAEAALTGGETAVSDKTASEEDLS